MRIARAATQRRLETAPVVALALAIGCALAGLARADDRAMLAALEQRSKAFYGLLERGERERAASVWPGLEADLARFRGDLDERLGRMRDEVIERDGDLEELYRSARWRDPEIDSLVAGYHLAWVRYQGAQLVGDAAKKKALLQKSVEGFSQFLLVNEVPEIYGESLLGRGLAFLDLGERDKAIADLTAAAAEPSVASKARGALEEARRRAGGGRAPEAEPESELARLGELLGRAAGDDPSAEKDATTLARGLAARGGTWPARVTSLVSDKLDERSTYGLFLLAQLAVDRGRCADVPRLADASAGLHDGSRARHRAELLFLDGGCLLNAGRPREAAEQFAALLREFPAAPRARDATYYRFRALDVARASDATLGAAYEDALRAYVAGWPHADGTAEAHWLLGELLRSRGDCGAADPEYRRVGPGPFAARAGFGQLQCEWTTVEHGGGDPSAFVARARTFARDTPDRELAGRAAMLGAIAAEHRRPPDHAAALELLDGFETRYPGLGDLAREARVLRLSARIETGDIKAARPDLEALLATPGRDSATLGRIGNALVTRADRLPAGEQGEALAAAHMVYAALARETDEPRVVLTLADLDLRTGDAAAARKRYEAVLRQDPTSSEASRGAARSATALGDRTAALAYWRRILDASAPGGTAWYEARLAQVELLAADGRRAEACALVRGARGRATTAGGDQMDARLARMEPEVCR